MEETNKISILDQFRISCTSPSQYKKLIGIPKWKVAIFVIALTLVTTFLGTVMDLIGLNISIGGLDNFIENRLPKFEMKNGILTADRDMDFSIAGTRFVMDTKKTTVSDDDFSGEGAMETYFTKTEMVSMNRALGRKITIQFKDYRNAVVNNKTLLQYIPAVYAVVILSVIMSFFISMIGYLVMCVFMAWLANWNLKIRKKDVPFSTVFQIAIYSRVPCVLLGTIGTLVGFAFFSSTIWWAISYIVSYELILFAFREPKPKQAE